MQGVAAKDDASYDLSRARASVTGQTTIAASTATTSLPNGRIVTAIDVLHGVEQELNGSLVNGNLVLRRLLVKDYPVILKLISP